jgi:hypothetical protein
LAAEVVGSRSAIRHYDPILPPDKFNNDFAALDRVDYYWLEHFPPWRNRKGISFRGQIMIHVEGW